MLNRLTIWLVHKVSLFSAKTPEQRAKVLELQNKIRLARKGMTWKESRAADKEVVEEMIRRAKQFKDYE